MNKQTLVSALKEVLRLFVFAVPGILIQVVTNNPNLTLGYGSVILAALRAVDKAVHESPDTSLTGIVPF